MKKCECCNILLPSQTDCSSVMLAEKEVNSDIFDMKIMLAFCKNQNGRYSLLAEAAGSRDTVCAEMEASFCPKCGRKL